MSEITNFHIFKNFSKEDFKALKKTEVYGLLLYLLFILGKLPDYKVLTNLLTMTDYNILLKLCEYFGGETITFPTLEQLNRALTVVQLYNRINIEEEDYNTVVTELKVEPQDIIDYNKLLVLLEKYGIAQE